MNEKWGAVTGATKSGQSQPLSPLFAKKAVLSLFFTQLYPLTKMPQRKRSFTFGAYGGVDKTFSRARSLWKQDGGEPCISNTLDPSLFQPSLPHTGPAFLKSNRMDEQRCTLPPPLKTEEDYIPYPSVHEVLGRKSPFPLILLPQFGGYWIEGTNHEMSNGIDLDQLLSPNSRFKLECNTTAKIYRKHFLGK
ncbi:hypothetical protein QQF64_020955, partial [Cirrhinus molitorella]